MPQMPDTASPDKMPATEQPPPLPPIPNNQPDTPPDQHTTSTNGQNTNHDHPGASGPTTPLGKEISSSNATAHGGTSQKLFVAGENPAEFHALHNSLLAEHNPITDSAQNLVYDFVLAQWFLWRRIRACNSVEHALYESEPDPALWPESSLRRLTLMERYRTTAERSFQRALSNLDHLKYANQSTERFNQRQQNIEARLAHDRERLALQTKRHELTKSREQAKQAEKDDDAYQAACGDDFVPSLSQNILVREGESGETMTEFNPPNHVLRLAIERATYRPELIRRHFTFADGVPQEYWWDDESAAHVTRPNYKVVQDLATDVWLRMAEEEEHRSDGHAIFGHFEDEEYDKEGEYDDNEEPESEDPAACTPKQED